MRTNLILASVLGPLFVAGCVSSNATDTEDTDGALADDAGIRLEADADAGEGSPDAGGPLALDGGDPARDASIGSGPTYYVDNTHPMASDSNPGSAGAPWRTLQHAAARTYAPGDTLVVAGTYTVGSGGTWNTPAIRPASSGTPGNPIVWMAHPTRGATVQCASAPPSGPLPDGTQSPIGVEGEDHIVLDGFEVQNCFAKGIGVFNATDVTISRCTVHGVNIDHAFDNSDGIRGENVRDLQIRDCEIYDVHNGSDTANAAGIKLYDATNTMIEHNELHDVPAGVFDKRLGVGTVIRRNYLHDTGRPIYMLDRISSIQIYENLIVRTESAAAIDFADRTDGGAVYNNTIYQYVEGAIRVKESSSNIDLYNNIYVSRGTPSTADLYTYMDPPTALRTVAYNRYAPFNRVQIGRYVTNRNYDTLAAWQAGHGLDGQSSTGDPGFVDPTAGDYHLRASSTARGAGRVGGTAGGAPVDLGAFPSGSGLVGIRP